MAAISGGAAIDWRAPRASLGRTDSKPWPWPRWLTPLVAVSVFVICRVPSFFEPNWYTDEAGYTLTAREVLKGLALYRGAWTNKPPLQIWAVALPLSLFGPSEAGLHLLTLCTGLVALIAFCLLVRAVLAPWRALLASVAFALAIGLPALDAELVVPESLLIAPVTAAGALLIWRISGGQAAGWWGRGGWAFGVGVLVGVGAGIQQTVLADAAAFLLLLLCAHSVRRSETLLYLAGMIVTVVAWLIPALLVGGVARVGFALVGFYGSYAHYSAPTSALSLAVIGLSPLLAVVGAFWLRRSANPMWASLIWAVAVLDELALAHRGYPHFWAPVAAPVILALVVLIPRLGGWGWRLAPLGMAFVMCGVLAASTTFEVNALRAYLEFPAALVTGAEGAWQLSFNSASAPADVAVSDYIRQNRPGESLVVWSSSAWPYLLASAPVQLRAGPIYNDVVLDGSGQVVAQRVDQLRPQLILTSQEAMTQWPQIETLLRSHYQLLFSAGVDRLYERVGPGTTG